MFSICSESPLPAPCAVSYGGMAFDGCKYYLTSRCEPFITVLDSDLCPVRSIRTCRRYGAICFDPRRGGFWAASPRCPFSLFRLDGCLRETDQLSLRSVCGCAAPISGLSFCCGCGTLLLSCGNRLLEINPEDGSVRPLLEERRGALILSVLCLPPFIIYNVLRGGCASFVLATREGRVLAEKELSAAQRVNAMLFDPCGRGCELFMLSHRQACYPHLLRARLNRKLLKRLCPCNMDICRVCGEKRPCREPRACADIIESIALTEASLAHILNAEGEKLQKAIEISSDADELLRFNESVRQTIDHVTRLEQVLLEKLNSIKKVCPCEEQCHSETALP